MYGRSYGKLTLDFEPSGGLINSSLVMQDKQTDSYWGLMQGEALAGELAGTRLEELPVGLKVRWRDWLARHPDTLVLSIDGREDVPANAYAEYFESDRGFRGQQASDDRLATKTPIFAFRLDGRSYAIAHGDLDGGIKLHLGERHLLLWRPPDAELFESTRAWSADSPFQKDEAGWLHPASGCQLAPPTHALAGAGACPEPLTGFDTFWYNWSLNNPDTAVVGN